MGGKLLDRLEDAVRIRGYSPRTGATYRRWAARFIRFHGLRHPAELNVSHIEAFLVHLAKSHASSTVNQAHSAVQFLYAHVLKIDVPGLQQLPWSRGSSRVPSVLTRTEVGALLRKLRGTTRLFCALLYGSGMRIGEGVALRVKDLDLEGLRVTVRAGKGHKDRVTVLSASLVTPLEAHLKRMREQHLGDIDAGAGWVPLPHAFAAKAPSAGRDWPWQWVFPAARMATVDAARDRLGRFPVHPSTVQRELARAARRAEIPKRVHPHVLRHSFATHFLNDGNDIRTLQALLGHDDIRMTIVYTHLVEGAAASSPSPLDRLFLDDWDE